MQNPSLIPWFGFLGHSGFVCARWSVRRHCCFCVGWGWGLDWDRIGTPWGSYRQAGTGFPVSVVQPSVNSPLHDMQRVGGVTVSCASTRCPRGSFDRSPDRDTGSG